jgi:hypothetical protein
MKNVKNIFSILAISLVFLSGCSSQPYHDYIMSGQVVAIDGKNVVVCIANTDGLKKHDVFNVFRTVINNSPVSEGESMYSRELVGKVRLGEKQDMHFAKAIVLSGDVIRYDMVEMNKD